jgi:hypothetical protein
MISRILMAIMKKLSSRQGQNRTQGTLSLNDRIPQTQDRSFGQSGKPRDPTELDENQATEITASWNLLNPP